MAYMALYIIRVVKGPSIWDRLLALDVISTKIIIIVVIFASHYELEYLLDFAIVYALLGFISIIFTARFLLQRMKGGKK